MKHLVLWRTAIVVVLMSVVMLVALHFCLSRGAGVEYFHWSVLGVIALATIAASKSAIEHIAAAFQGVTALGGLFGAGKSAAAQPPAAQ